MSLNHLIIILLIFIFIYISISSSKGNRESFTNKNQLSQETIDNDKTNSILEEYGLDDILRVIDNNINNFKISNKQYQKIRDDIYYLFKYHQSQFIKKKVEDKKFMISFLNNKVILLNYQKKIKLYIFMYLFINQDQISKEKLYDNYKQQYGPFLYFTSLDEYINKNNIIYQKIPYNYSKILNIQDIIYLYESLRVKGVIPFLSLLSLDKYYTQYLKKKKKFVKNREPLTIQNTNDPSYQYYYENLKKVSTFPTDLGYEGINVSNNYIDISSKKKQPNIQEIKSDSHEHILPLNYHLEKNIGSLENKKISMLNDKFINTRRDLEFMRYNKNNNFMLKPLKWKCQRQWEETQGPNFIDKDYIYPAGINST